MRLDLLTPSGLQDGNARSFYLYHKSKVDGRLLVDPHKMDCCGRVENFARIRFEEANSGEKRCAVCKKNYTKVEPLRQQKRNTSEYIDRNIEGGDGGHFFTHSAEEMENELNKEYEPFIKATNELKETQEKALEILVALKESSRVEAKVQRSRTSLTPFLITLVDVVAILIFMHLLDPSTNN